MSMFNRCSASKPRSNVDLSDGVDSKRGFWMWGIVSKRFFELLFPENDEEEEEKQQLSDQRHAQNNSYQNLREPLREQSINIKSHFDRDSD